MKLSWGWKIGILYGGFVIFMSSLVVASNRQHFDLVSKDYYEEEIAYQKVIDAGSNQSKLSQPFSIHANETEVIIDFPNEFKDKVLSGDIKFYSPVNADWDKDFTIKTENNTYIIPRTSLHNTSYTIKISCSADGKNYYQASEILLHK